jgi:hypothetical protein
MNRRLKIHWLYWLVLLVASPGCLVTHHATNVVREKEPRREVRFESDQVRQAFEARIADLKDRGEKPHKERVVAVPFLLWWSREEVLAENAWYNDQVAVCDVNRDTLITFQEALAYNPRFREGVDEVAGWNAEQAAAATANARTAYEQPLAPPTSQPWAEAMVEPWGTVRR